MMKKIAVCPNNPAHHHFITTAHEAHTWEVDEDGAFIKDLGCDEVTHQPDEGNIWTCTECGADAGRNGSKMKNIVWVGLEDSETFDLFTCHVFPDKESAVLFFKSRLDKYCERYLVNKDLCLKAERELSYCDDEHNDRLRCVEREVSKEWYI